MALKEQQSKGKERILREAFQTRSEIQGRKFFFFFLRKDKSLHKANALEVISKDVLKIHLVKRNLQRFSPLLEPFQRMEGVSVA